MKTKKQILIEELERHQKMLKLLTRQLEIYEQEDVFVAMKDLKALQEALNKNNEMVRMTWEQIKCLDTEDMIELEKPIENMNRSERYDLFKSLTKEEVH